jgi:hypothetical protein
MTVNDPNALLFPRLAIEDHEEIVGSDGHRRRKTTEAFQFPKLEICPELSEQGKLYGLATSGNHSKFKKRWRQIQSI